MTSFDYTNQHHIIYLVLALAILALLVLVIRHKVDDYLRQRKVKKRFDRGAKLELDAKRFLQNKGYTIIDYQSTYDHHYQVDGIDHTATIQPDYMVRKKGKTYIVEVKSGTSAISASNRNTRRQLLEYDYVIKNDGVLLLDMENKNLQLIRFKTKAERRSSLLTKALIILALIGIAIPYLPAQIAIGIILVFIFVIVR